MKKIQKIIALCLMLTSSVMLSGCGFKDNSQKYGVKLEIWGVFDDTDAYGSILSDYKKLNPYITEIKYKKLNVDTYKQDLLDALASGKGPDIFLIRNSWVPSFQDKIVAAPATFTDERGFREAFVDVVASDFMDADKKIYGVPLSVDSLGLYYNKDIFNAAGILTPPATWEDFARDAALLTKVDEFGNITQAGAAIGTAYNINRSTDVLSAMMLQAGVPFHTDRSTGIDFKNGEPALEFYTQFANTQSPTYTWNTRQHYSVDAFYEGQTAMMVNYSWQYETLKHKNAKLNIGVAPLPQFAEGTKANYANYWGYVVAKNKEFGPEVTDKTLQDKLRVHEAWEFLRYLTMPNGKAITLYNAITGTAKEFPLATDPAQVYLSQTKKPAARRDLIELARRDLVLGPFAEGNIIAKNWTQANPEAVETIFAEVIDSINRGAATVHGALGVAQNRIGYLIK
ncbi:MAG: extracellular solute-binding protein [Candidatus Moranbacteria bacterium]|nr:extracellular solute-binding protein [Candidatus Moranbacteria bacterium]